MSEAPRLPDPAGKTTTRTAKPGDSRAVGRTGRFAAREGGVRFVSATPEPDDTHKQLVIEALEQMFKAGAQALFLDPSADSFKVVLSTDASMSELGELPLAVGRLMVESIRREAALPPGSGIFLDGVLRVEYAKAERRMHVHLIPTAHGMAAALRVLPSLPAANATLKTLGLSPTQATQLDEILSQGNGVILVGGTDPAWLASTSATCLSRAASAGRRAAVLAASRGSDLAGVARVEVENDDQQARAIVKLAEAGVSCMALENIFTPATVLAAASSAMSHKAVVLLNVASRSAPHALAQFLAQRVPGSLAASVVLAMSQIQLPLLCPACSRWGDVSRDDLRFFNVNTASKNNFYVRNASCPKCRGNITDFSQVFEMLPISDTVRNSLRAELPYAQLEKELLGTPGYAPFLEIVVEAAKEGRCSLTEARQYIMWQIPPPNTADAAV